MIGLVVSAQFVVHVFGWEMISIDPLSFGIVLS
jgi:NADH:ubiquinone oxidoreductase subunit 5 (subunit L)/multisubunit Na+/H+ antiporter MnhA subunit